MGRGRVLKTTMTSLEIVDMIKELDGAKFAEVARQIDRPKSTVYSHLNTLVHCGYLVKTDGEYHVSHKYLHIGEYVRNRHDGYSLAKESVHRLAVEANKLVDFTVEESGRLITIHAEDRGAEERTFQVGRYYYLHTTAAGKAILAERSDSFVEEVLDEHGLPKLTDNTITERSVLYDELATYRDQGYAVNDQEFVNGLRSVGTVLRDGDGEIVGALSIGGPLYHNDMEYLHEELSEILLEEASRFQQKMADR